MTNEWHQAEWNENSADYARNRGWKVGTILIGKPIVHRGVVYETDRRIRITAIGEECVLAVPVDGKYRENSWRFCSREWKEYEEEHTHAWTAAYDDLGDSWLECNCGAER